METIWFILISLVVAVYAATDGFDLGAGILSPLIARKPKERAVVRTTIIGVWAANEVWLIAMGGLLFMAFPRAYAAAFSGFYLAFLVLVWCLIGRGLALEMRSQLREPLWQSACDILLPVASFLVAFALGTAVGNVLRGLPLDARGRLFLPLWTDFSLGGGPAIFDWYTLIVGLLAVAACALHGANYVALKTEGELRRRARRLARLSAIPTGGLALATAILSPVINPALAANYVARPASLLIIAFVVIAFVATLALGAVGHDFAACAASGFLLAGFVVSAAIALYPSLLPGRPDPEYGLTIYNTSASPHGLTVALIWFAVGLALVGFYAFFVYRLFAGKVNPDSDAY
jgi:cytochrome d ubiquinol oxidase subunit II